MTNKIISITISFLLFLNFSVFSFAENTDLAENTVQKILEYKLSDSDDIQQFIDTTLSENAGISAEWYAVTLSQTGQYNFESYEKALLNYLDNNRVSSASSRLKYSLALMAIGSKDSYIADNFDSSIGQQGVMSWVFGLHILNNGFISENYTIDSVCQSIISLQLDDGGFAVTGNKGNSDVTAMVITAFAPLYDKNSDVKLCVDKALEFLSNDQNEYGGFESYGVYCAESTAQVLMALSSLGIDCAEDERFIKKGITVLDSLSDFMLPDGSFSHEINADTNENATSQAYYCISSYLKMHSQDKFLFVFEDNSVAKAPTDTAEITDSITDTDKPEADADNEKADGNIKTALIIGVIILVVFLFIVLFISKKKNIRNFLGIGCIGIILIAIILKLDIKTTDGFYDTSSKGNIIGSVTIEIASIPTDANSGIILEKTEIELSQGQTAYDILLEACTENKIQLETNGMKGAEYVEGINHIYEFDYGELSGWMYYVNGKSPSVSCASYVLSDKDAIAFIYSTQMGSDIVFE